MSREIHGRLTSETSIGEAGTGRPDYTGEQFLARTHYGYALASGESHVWPYIMCFEGGGSEPLAGNREPLAPGQSVDLIEAFSGLPYLHCDAGEDYLLKAVFISFNVPILYEQLQMIGGVEQHACYVTYPANTPQPYSPWHLGWRRTLLEDLNTASNTIFRLTNMGAVPGVGKAWILGVKKKGAYTVL